MGFLGLFKGKDKGEDGSENEPLLDFKTQEKGNAEELTQLLNGKLLREKLHGRSYVEEKIKQLQEQALLRKYEQDFVPSYNFDEEGFLQKLKSEIENMWRNFLIALIFFTKGSNSVDDDGDEEFYTDEQIIKKVEGLAPGLTKTVAQNLLKKMEAQKELLDHTEMSDSDALIGSLMIEAKSKQEALNLLISTEKDLCHPRDLDVDFKDPLWTEYAIYRKNLQNKKQKYEALIAIYTSYTKSTKSIFEKRDELSVTTEDRVNSSMRLKFSSKHPKNSLPYKLEEQQLSKDIEEACIPIQTKRQELESEIEQSKRDRIASALNMFDIQRKRLPMGSYANSKNIHVSIRGNKELVNAMRNKDKNPIEYWYVQKDPSISIAGHQNFQVYKVLVSACDYTLSINPVSEDVFLENCEKLSKIQRQYLIEIFSDDTKEVQVSSLSLPQEVNAYQENRLNYIRLGSVSTGAGLYFTDGKVLDNYSLKNRLDKWIEQYVSYEKAPNDLGGYIVSIHHPELPVQYYYEPTAEDFDKLVGSTEETTESIIKSVSSNSMHYRMKSVQNKSSISSVSEMPRTVKNKKGRDENYTKLFFEALQKLEISITLCSRSMDDELMSILAKDLGFEDTSDIELFALKTASLMYVRNQGGGTYLYDSAGDDDCNAIQLEMHNERRRYEKVSIGPGVDTVVKTLFQR